mmetsp:Transcript_4146/g.10298  ORF Transcript_4146/g.10298 Transcript_4146/m.10298 type:complete len:288 (-) Transcript_4146:628-1491(-)
MLPKRRNLGNFDVVNRDREGRGKRLLDQLLLMRRDLRERMLIAPLEDQRGDDHGRGVDRLFGLPPQRENPLEERLALLEFYVSDIDDGAHPLSLRGVRPGRTQRDHRVEEPSVPAHLLAHRIILPPDIRQAPHRVLLPDVAPFGRHLNQRRQPFSHIQNRPPEPRHAFRAKRLLVPRTLIIQQQPLSGDAEGFGGVGEGARGLGGGVAAVVVLVVVDAVFAVIVLPHHHLDQHVQNASRRHKLQPSFDRAVAHVSDVRDGFIRGGRGFVGSRGRERHQRQDCVVEAA